MHNNQRCSSIVSDYEQEQWYKKGMQLHTGDGMVQNYAQAIIFFEKAAKCGHAASQVMLGICFEKGQGVEKNLPMAVYWYAKAAEQGKAYAKSQLQKYSNIQPASLETDAFDCDLPKSEYTRSDAQALYDKGIKHYLGKNYAEAVKLFRLSSEFEFAKAQVYLGICYHNGTGVSKDIEEAVRWYRMAAAQDDIWGLEKLAQCYMYGYAVSKDAKKAEHLYLKSAKGGYVKAQYELGMLYESGSSDGTVAKNGQEAVKWYRKAAEQRNIEAQFRLGFIYDYGKIVPQNISEAVNWYTKAAQNRHVKAQCMLGIIYLETLNNITEAQKWLLLSAKQGNVDAMAQLAYLYDTHGKRDEAILWYEKAANTGDVSAMYMLGLTLMERNGRPISAKVLAEFDRGTLWIRKAASLGHEGAKKEIAAMRMKGITI